MKNNFLFLISFFLGVALAWHSFEKMKAEDLYNESVNMGKMPGKSVKHFFPEKYRSMRAYLKESAGDLEAAADEYTNVIAESGGTDKLALFNIGNVSVKMAIAMKNGKMIETAVEYYKAALRVDPEFDDAKYNLEIALRFLKKIQGGQPQNSNDNGEGGGRDRGDPGPGSYTPFKAGDI